MKILIVSYYFAPQNIIGSVRPTKLAKYLARMGHDVTVVCGVGRNVETDPKLENDLQELRDVHIVREWNPIRTWYLRKESRKQECLSSSSLTEGFSRAKPLSGEGAGRGGASPCPPEAAAGTGNVKLSWKRKVLDAVYMYLWWLADLSFARCAKRELKKLQGPYDAVFSTYTPYSSHIVAREARKSGLAKRWIADFRDEVHMNFSWQEGRRKRFMQMIRRDADLITAVSDGFLELMDFTAQGRVLSNGFDREDLPQVQAEAHEGLRVVYCGQLRDSRRFMGNRDITAMFRALRSLIDEGLLSEQELHLVYAGREGALMREYAAACGLEDCVEDHGQVSRGESIRLQRSADILLMASMYYQSQKGILTGKLFEYMMMEKPIVCCMKGDLPGSGVKQVLSETGMGLCCEEAAGTADEEALLAYVRRLVQLWRSGEPMLKDQNQQAVEAYAYPGLAQTLSRWMAE